MQPRGWSPLIRFLNQDHMRAMQRFRMADVSLRFPRKSGRNTTIGMASPGPRRCWAAAATLRRNIVAAVLWRNIATPLDLLILRLTACKMSKSNALQPISASQPSNPLTLRESGARMSKSNTQAIQIEPPHNGSAHSARRSPQNEQIRCPAADFTLSAIRSAHSAGVRGQNEQIQCASDPDRAATHRICSFCATIVAE